MTPQPRKALKLRQAEIEQELKDLADGKLSHDVDPHLRQAELLDERDLIAFELEAGNLTCGMDDAWQDDS